MVERFTLGDAGYTLYSDVIERLHQRYPDVALWRVAQIVTAENEAITGGQLHIVPTEVETGAEEMLEREQRRAHDGGGEVA